MSRLHHFDTVRIGILAFTLDGHDYEFDSRILRRSDGIYFVLSGALSPPFKTLEDAIAHAESPTPAPPEVSFEMQWRDNIDTLRPDEQKCFICHAPIVVSPRYPQQLCPACILEATDAQGRFLRFGNESLGGGLVAHYVDDNGVYRSVECFVRGIPCRAEEHRFGGVVLLPRL